MATEFNDRIVHGDVLTAISNGLVALLKEYYGVGPTQGKTYYQDDLVVCVLRGASPALSKRCSTGIAVAL